jgi:hypothetical protein
MLDDGRNRYEYVSVFVIVVLPSILSSLRNLTRVTSEASSNVCIPNEMATIEHFVDRASPFKLT